ncbi:hypothetical protein [Aquiflexum sp.]|uniref:hypothetical protein n=1 Tax=Aquiflexum sp. TaxID=1872584 RepID=UPI0035948553
MQLLNHTLLSANLEVLGELEDMLIQIQSHNYKELSPALKTSSIGQHCRHILEFYICLIDQYEDGKINYDKRERDKTLDSEKNMALEKIELIKKGILKPDKEILLCHKVEGKKIELKSSYFREILYNLEHCIHHQALLKLACLELGYMELPESFGIARSTLAYKSDH